MAKRTTRTNAETLENVRKQAEERGRALGRQDLAVELMGLLARDDQRIAEDLVIHFKAYSYGLRDAGDPPGEVARARALSCYMGRVKTVIAQITEEANTPAF